jgi:hypothetical protein
MFEWGSIDIPQSWRCVWQSYMLLVLLVISLATWAVDKQTEEARNSGHGKVILTTAFMRGLWCWRGRTPEIGRLQ